MEIAMDINPVIEYWPNGNKQREQWFFDNQYHRVDGPADILYYESGQVQREEWLFDSRLHREDGRWHDVFKDPVDDPGKSSKKGELALVKENGIDHLHSGSHKHVKPLFFWSCCGGG